MKIALLFLCVALASFIDTSNGNGALSFTKIKVDAHVQFVHSLGNKLQLLQTLSILERNTFIQYLLHDIIFELKILALELDCTLSYLLQISGLPSDISGYILAGNVDALLAIVVADVEGLLIRPVCFLLEALLAKVGILLKGSLNTLNGLLGITGGLFSSLSFLHGSITQIVASLSVVLAGVLGVVGGLLTPVTTVVGTLSGGLLGR